MHHPSILKRFDCREGDAKPLAFPHLPVQTYYQANNRERNEEYLNWHKENNLKKLDKETQYCWTLCCCVNNRHVLHRTSY